jgi:hypothetical protein
VDEAALVIGVRALAHLAVDTLTGSVALDRRTGAPPVSRSPQPSR